MSANKQQRKSRSLIDKVRISLCSGLAALTLIGNAGCCTVIDHLKRSDENVSISSNPPGATVKIDDVDRGVTPFEVKLSRMGQEREYSLKIEKQGYFPSHHKIYVRSGLLGDPLERLAFVLDFFSVAGALIDIVNEKLGGFGKLYPEQIYAPLVKEGLAEPPLEMQDNYKNKTPFYIGPNLD